MPSKKPYASGPMPEHGGDVERQHGGDRLRGDVGEQADHAEGEDGAGHLAAQTRGPSFGLSLLGVPRSVTYTSGPPRPSSGRTPTVDRARTRRPQLPTRSSGSRSPHSQAQPIWRPGLPTTKACGGTSRTTTAPAPTKAFSPMVTPQTTVTRAPSVAPCSTLVARSASPCRLMRARGVQVVGEGHAGSQEHVVGDLDALEDHHLVLDRDPVPDHGPALDVGAVADVAVAPDPRPRQDVGERPDPGAVTDVVAVTQTLRVHEDARVRSHSH